MTKTEYMKILARSLRRLPKEDYDRAIEYFEEYFAEAGPENEQQAVSDLGSPEEAAKEPDHGSAAQNIKEKPKTVKRGLSTLWIAVLALCAASPSPLPLHTDRSGSPSSLRRGRFVVLWQSPPSRLSHQDPLPLRRDRGTLPLRGRRSVQHRPRLFAGGIGILLVYGSVLLFKWCIRKVSVSLGKMTKGGKNHEKNN